MTSSRRIYKMWSDIWSVASTHNHHAGWLQSMKQELLDVEKQEDIKIKVESIPKYVSGVSNWKAPWTRWFTGFLI